MEVFVCVIIKKIVTTEIEWNVAKRNVSMIAEKNVSRNATVIITVGGGYLFY